MTTETCENRIAGEMASRAADYRRYMNEPELYENGEEADLPPFNEYGYGVSYVEPYTWQDQERGYWRLELSGGGPSDDVRFFSRDRVEYWFMDWGDGAHRDITSEDWAAWLVDYYSETVPGFPNEPAE